MKLMNTQFTSEVHTVLYALLSAALFTYLIILHAFLSSADFLQGHFLEKKTFRNTIRESNSLEPYKAQCFVGPDLGPDCL